MMIELERFDSKPNLTHEEVMGEFDTLMTPFDYGPFEHLGTNEIYFPVDDKANGPFWLRLDCQTGRMDAFSPASLELWNNICSVDPRINIKV